MLGDAAVDGELRLRDVITEEVTRGIGDAVNGGAVRVSGQRVNVLALHRGAEILYVARRVDADGLRVFVRRRREAEQAASGGRAGARPDVNISVRSGRERAMHRRDVLQISERLHIAVTRIEHEQVTALARGRAVNLSSGRGRQRRDGRFAGGNHVERRISQVAGVDTDLGDHGAVGVERALRQSGRGTAEHNAESHSHERGLYISSASR